MEYLDGETLAERLKKGPLPCEQLLKMGIEIADALDRAHRHGIVHRDLKPGNIMLMKTGAKLLDFGLAKTAECMAYAATGPGSGFSGSLTQTSPVAAISAVGTIIGTVHYMAPEQVEGKEADARSDIFAFGAVMYEASTGRRAFEGGSPMSVAAAILQTEPKPLATFQPGCSLALDYIVRTCLAKDPEDRFQSAHDLKLQLNCLLHSSDSVALPIRKRSQNFWLAAGAAVFVVLALALVRLNRAPSLPAAYGVTRFSIALPKGQELATDTTEAVVVSRDGRRLAYVAAESGVPHLYVRRIDRFDSVQIPDSEGAVFPFFSPTGDWIAFFSQGKLKKAPADGGNPVLICDLPTFFGGTWTGKGVIVVAVPGFGIATVSPSGGSLQKVSLPTSEHIYPEGPVWLGEGDWIAFTDYYGTARRVFAVNVASGQLRVIATNAQAGSYASGHFVYFSGGAVWATPFDINKLTGTGEATQIASGVNEENYVAQSSASANGMLAYAPGDADSFSRNMYLVNRSGVEQKLDVPADDYVDPAISPDGKRIAICIRSAGETGQQLALYDRDRNVLTRVVSDAALNEAPVWTAEGKNLLFNVSGAAEKHGIYIIPADGSAAPQLLSETSVTTHLTSAVGDYAAVMVSDPVTSTDLWLLSLRDHQMHVFRKTPATERQGSLSPDGHWMAYSSNESGRSDIYVEPVSGAGGRWKISADGGEQPRWVRNGREILYRNGTKLMSVPVAVTPVFRAGRPLELFDRKFDRGGSVGGYDVSPDGQMLVMTRSAHPNPTEIRIVMGWPFEANKSAQ
jgi:Tol biopolymer transport system component